MKLHSFLTLFVTSKLGEAVRNGHQLVELPFLVDIVHRRRGLRECSCRPAEFKRVQWVDVMNMMDAGLLEQVSFVCDDLTEHFFLGCNLDCYRVRRVKELDYSELEKDIRELSEKLDNLVEVVNGHTEWIMYGPKSELYEKAKAEFEMLSRKTLEDEELDR